MYDIEAMPFLSSQSIENIIKTKWKIPPIMNTMLQQQKSNIVHQFEFASDIPIRINANGTAGLEDSELSEDM